MSSGTSDSSSPNVIWVSGFSGSGKTTVGRLAAGLLRDRAVDVIFLDGDDLRRVFSRRWGYERSDRIELAHVYFRLCNYLATQEFTVIIAAVAMYDEVRSWIRDSIAGVYEVYLDVPEEERVRRDARTKQVYPAVGATNSQYDPPTKPDLRIANFGETTPGGAAQQIVDGFLSSRMPVRVASVRRDHWNEFYTQGFGDRRPSPFALAVAAEIGSGKRVLEVGCGNGRDAFFFAGLGHEVVAVDASHAAIESCRIVTGAEAPQFVLGRFPDIATELTNSYDVGYSRFTLHAMTQGEQDEALTGFQDQLAPGGRLFVECRSINDPLARAGEVISPTERIHGHYRRFVVLEELLAQLELLGFSVESAAEGSGLAPYGDEDPVVIRVRASKGR